ncbi:MAG: glycosyltransferase family 4 protein [Bacteroidaceae bacterium]|nr:glycosyltransferase family 4 protein [Bacteroidaceae bacterium]
MKIAIEAQRIFRKNKHGMDFVALEAIRELQELDKQNEYYILVSPGEDRCLCETPNFHVVEIKVPTYPLWEQYGLPRALKRIKPDLLHCTSNTAPLYCNVPLVLTLHDVIFMEKRQGKKSSSLYQQMGWYYRRWNVPRILRKCTQIITVSHFEAARISSVMNIPQEMILTVYNGFSHHFKPVGRNQYADTVNKYCESPNYFFFLGNTDPKKNTLRTLKAYARYLQQSRTNVCHLLIADLDESVIDAYLQEGGITHIKPYLRFPGYIPNTDLPAIYSGAQAFIYTSLRESFGIPILEAMACGTPVITSNTSAIPEIAGEGAILVDPTDEKAIADKMLHVAQDREYCVQQIEYGLQRVKNFSWRRTAEELLKVYQSLSGK